MIFFSFILFRSFISITCVFQKDPPIERFVQRHMYLSIDAIVDRDLGFAMARKATATYWERTRLNNRSCHLVHRNARNEWLPRVVGAIEKITGGGGGGDDHNQGNQQMRPSSPPRGVDRDRETRWEGAFFSSSSVLATSYFGLG